MKEPSEIGKYRDMVKLLVEWAVRQPSHLTEKYDQDGHKISRWNSSHKQKFKKKTMSKNLALIDYEITIQWMFP